MVLITQGFPFIDVEDLSHIARSMSPDELYGAQQHPVIPEPS
jgi:hypothetical protein